MSLSDFDYVQIEPGISTKKIFFSYLTTNYNKIPRMKNSATLKYIIRPVTSTNVATKGAEEEAGSAPSFFKMIGNILPVNVPQRTTPIREKLTVRPTRSQRCP